MLKQMTTRSKRSKQRGEVALEMAFVVSLVLLPLIFGIVDFSRALYGYHWVAYAAREGTRWASVRGANCSVAHPLPGGCPATTGQVQAFVQSIRAPGIYSVACTGLNVNPGCISVTTTWSGLGGDGLDCTNGGLTATNSPGCMVQVQVNYTFPFTLPFIGALTGNGKTFTSTSQMIISN
jgi:Flp pilus assembly protein TadG